MSDDKIGHLKITLWDEFPLIGEIVKYLKRSTSPLRTILQFSGTEHVQDDKIFRPRGCYGYS